MSTQKPKEIIRCVIYGRKSHEEGLEQEYNSLDAQWDAGSQYIGSQRALGWVLSEKRYMDGGFTGGNMERPALQELLDDIKLGLIDVVVVYKIDRLTRSLLDFAQLAQTFSKHGVEFVSVTEHFNTATPMGRLMLHIILSFAQFERELTGERIRDKFRESKKNGIWMGGCPPLGYDVKERKLIINRQEAKIITFMFEQYQKHGSIVRLTQDLKDRCYRGKSWTTLEGKKREGKTLNVTVINKMMRNPVYKGFISHKGQHYPGEHEAIIAPDVWDAAQKRNRDKTHRPRSNMGGKSDQPYLLRGLIFDRHGAAMTPSNGGKTRHKRYRYYVSTTAMKYGYDSTDLRSIPAEQIEPVIVGHLRQFITMPEIIHRTHEKALQLEPNITVDEVRENLTRFNEIWDQLFPLEQNRIVQLIVKRVVVGLGGIEIIYHPNGIMDIYEQISEAKRA